MFSRSSSLPILRSVIVAFSLWMGIPLLSALPAVGESNAIGIIVDTLATQGAAVGGAGLALGGAVYRNTGSDAKGAFEFSYVSPGTNEVVRTVSEIDPAVRASQDHIGCGYGLVCGGGGFAQVAAETQTPDQRYKAVVGLNAYAYEPGNHQNAVIRERSTYEIHRSDYGGAKDRILLGRD